MLTLSTKINIITSGTLKLIILITKFKKLLNLFIYYVTNIMFIIVYKTKYFIQIKFSACMNLLVNFRKVYK